jgi:hypothetical protein
MLTTSFDILPGSRILLVALVLAVAGCAALSANTPGTTATPIASPAAPPSMRPPASPPSPSGVTLAGPFGPADIGSDARFRETLAAHKHDPDLAAPARLRRLIELLGEAEYMTFSVALERDGERLVLGWYLHELQFSGELPQLRSRLWAALESLGLAPLVPPLLMKTGGQQVWTAARDTVSERVTVKDGAPTVGGDEPGYSVSLYWREEAVAPAAPITLRSAVSAFPFFKLPGVDAAVYDELADEPIDAIGVGGHWTRTYDLDLTLVSATDARVGQLLSKAGFVDDGRSRDERRLRRGRSGSYAFVRDRDKKGRLGLRIQPFSS